MNLDKLSADTLGQMVESEEISQSFSSGFKDKIKKIGATALMTAVLAVGSGMGVAHAENSNVRNVMLGMSAVTGMVASGSTTVAGQHIDCGAAEKSGWKIGGAAAAGTVIGNQMGKGDGNVAMTILGGLIGGAVANSSEEERIKRECYNNVNATNNGGIPRYASKTSSQQSPIIYEGQSANGQSFYVTMKDSPGLAALQGRGQVPMYAVDSDPIVKSALDKASDYLVDSYHKVDEAAKAYQQIVTGQTTVGKLSRYAVEQQDVTASSQLQRMNQQKIQQAKSTLDEAYADYAGRRAVAGNIFDNAAVDRFDIKGYADVVPFFNPPASLAIRYERGTIPNKYGVIPNQSRP